MLADLPDNHHQRTIAQAIRHCSRFGLAVDIGAHRGIVTHQLLAVFGRVVAIEPSELADKIDPRAAVVRAAVGALPGQCSMANGTENTGQRHVIPGSGTPMITLDSLSLSPDFVKIDVEGMELDVLVGGSETIRANRPTVMIEETGLSERYGHPTGAAGALLESWGARRVAVINKDWIYRW